MTDSSNYARLREQTMGSLLEEEAVTVNTRALIDKVLARYSGEWTTLRELIQNAADAQASHVTIRFETLPSSTVALPQSSAPADRLKHTLLHHTLKTLLVSNDGDVFGENDWSRLKRIAEGNPDETKIGAFGVGFYSVFADCESPFVSSGNQSMAFYWKKDSLFTRRGKLGESDSKKDTTFLLDYRNTTTPVPQLLSICQFLATSLTFVGLSGIDLFVDDWHILKLTKKMAPGVNISLPKDVNPKTKDGLMKITGVEYQNAQIDARWMNVVGWSRTSQAVTGRAIEQPQGDAGTGSLRGWLSRLAGGVNSGSVAAKRAQKEEEALQQAIAEDLPGFSNATVFLRLSTVSVQTFVSRSLAAELERATKKPPPKHTKIAILTSSYDEASASMSTMSGAGSKSATAIFASVLPSKNGKIFIGFPTAQTTGLLAHISAPSVIPTVERESIDLNARYVRDWNVELLRVAGIACRVAFTGEMIELKTKLERNMSVHDRKKITAEDITAVMPAAIHVLKQYNYEESTPSAKVGQFIEEAFWTCNQKASIDILSTRGILPSQQVRVATEDLSFVEGIPVIPEELMKKGNDFITKLRDYGLLSDITTADIKKELEAQALTEAQVTELLRWAAKKVSSQDMDSSVVQNLFDGTVATVKEEFIATSASPVIQLGSIKTFVNTAKVPAEMPVPAHTIPFRLTSRLNTAQLLSLGWEELQIVPWVRWIVETDGNKFGKGASFVGDSAVACQVLPVISKGWDTLGASSKQTIVDLLVPRTIIPTKLGMKTPPQAYFASVKLFDDLPTIHGLQSVKEKFLFALGVRKTVELNVVFERLMAKSQSTAVSDEGKWSHVDLIRYLLSVKDDIPADDIKRLRSTPICPAETKAGDKAQLYKLSELYEPGDAIRRLGLPILQWPGVYRSTTPEGRFLRSLGLQAYPDVPALVDILNKAPANSDLQKAALEYFMSNTFHNGYNQYPMSKIDKAFLPVQPLAGETGQMIAKPSQCFANPRAAALRFRILRADLQPQHSIFGVAMDPPIDTCAERLIKQPPLDREQAKTLFGYFAGRLNEVGPSGNLANRLGNAPIVPIFERRSEKRASGVRFVSPVSVFLGDSESYGDIFDFVDFGLEANSFLLRVGSKHEPSASEIAYMVVRQPARLLSTLGAEKYLQLLRRLADNATALKKDKTLWASLRQSECLLAVKETTRFAMAGNEKVREAEDEEHLVREYSLASAADVVIVDDFGTYRLFQNDLLCAPQEEPLENFYAALDTPFLSRLIEDDQRMGALLRDQTPANKLKKLIVERCRLFLHDHQPDSIRHDAKWVEKSVDVRATEYLRITRRLRGYRMQFIEKRTAALHRESKKDAVLYVTASYDLFEVSRALMSLLLKRPRQQDYLALETLMESDLSRLKTKGYNVDRILRQKAEESRIAASERQKKEEEQRRIAEAQEQSRAAGIAAGNAAAFPMHDAPGPEPSTTPEKSLAMPGAFESPEQSLATRGKKMTNLFSQLKNQLGFNASEGSSGSGQHMQSMLGGNDFPPPYDSAPQPGKNTTVGGVKQGASPQDLQKTLSSAVKAAREHDQSALFSRPEVNNIKDMPSYCDSRPGHNLVFIADLGQGIKFFIDKSNPDPRRFLDSNRDAVAAFVVVLINCAAIFELPAKTLNMYYDDAGETIAFNRGGSIFCNLRFFVQLHANSMVDPRGRMEAMSYWWITLCHELAHNLVEDHSAKHSFYTESFAHHYFGRLGVALAPARTDTAVKIPYNGSASNVRRPANIPLHNLSAASSTRHHSGYREDEKASHDRQHLRPSGSFDGYSDDDSYSLYSDTGDLGEQLAEVHDPLADPYRQTAEAERAARRGGKKVRYASSDNEKDRGYRAPSNKEDIEIPRPPLRRLHWGERLLVTAMAPSDSHARMHGLHGKKLIYFLSIFVSLGVFLFGYDQGVMSGIITGRFFKDYFDQPSRAEIGTMVAILEVGAFISSLVVGQIGDLIGRRKTIFYGAVVFVIGGAFQTFATGMPMMLLGRIVAGLGVGALSTIVPVYQSEISPPHNRGKLACIEFSGNILGYMVSVWVDYFCSYIESDWSWRVPLLMQVVMGGLLAAGSFLIVESPRWLLDNDHDEEGIVVIANLYGKGDIHNSKARDEYREIKMNVLLQRQEGERSYRDMFKRYYKRVFIAMSAQALAQLNGINVISYYAPLVFEQAGWTGRDAILMTGINGLTYLASTIPPWYVVDRLGRRFILLSGAVAMVISLSAISYFIYLAIPSTPTMVVIFVMLYNAAFGYSWGPIPWLYPPEILPMSIRAKGASLSTATNWAFNWLVGEMTPVLQEWIKWRLYLLHAFFCAVSFVVVWFIYPETANVRLEDMNSIFGDATTLAPTPQTLAEAESLFSGNRSPVPSFRLGGDAPQDDNVPDLDIDPPQVELHDGKPVITREENEGVGGWIGRMINRGKGNDSGKYHSVGQRDD